MSSPKKGRPPRNGDATREAKAGFKVPAQADRDVLELVEVMSARVETPIYKADFYARALADYAAKHDPQHDPAQWAWIPTIPELDQLGRKGLLATAKSGGAGMHPLVQTSVRISEGGRASFERILAAKQAELGHPLAASITLAGLYARAVGEALGRYRLRYEGWNT
jgi:hypothetical protein